MNKALAAVALVVALVIGATAGFFVWTRLTVSDRDDPETVALPAPNHSDEAAAYLADDGRKVVLLHDALARRPAGNDQGDCLDFATRDLADQGTPRQMASRAASVPDQALADMALSEFRALTTFLAACGSGQGVDEADSDLEFARIVLDRQLKQEGIV